MNKNWYAVITADVLYNKSLKPRQKLLIASIANLSNDKGYCFASNKHFSEMFDCTPRTIQRDIESLIEQGFLNRILKLNPKGEVELRVLTPMTPMSYPHDENDTTPHDKDVIYNNKTINNKDNKLNYIPKNQKNDFKADYELKGIKVNGAITIKPKKVFSGEIEKCFRECLRHFEFHLLPNDKDALKWKETIDKLHRIDKIPYNMIVEIVQWARKDEFWSKNFLSLRKLRNKDKNGIMYVVNFSEKMKSSVKPSKSENTLNAMNEMLNKINDK